MCGIFGLVEPAGSSESQLAVLKDARTCLQHRGPDDFGFEQWESRDQNASIGFGQTRLAIIDLSPGGHQPQNTPEGRYSIVFNGEIYNYLELRAELKQLGVIFKSQSDTEVLLHAWAVWGESVLPKLEGMFAFAVYDSYANTITCVRDAFGIKPLFYFNDGKRFGFASELSALKLLRDSAPELNTEVAISYLVDGSYDTGRDTFFAGIKTVLPGEMLTLRFGSDDYNIDLEKWWQILSIEPREVSFSQAVEKVRHEFLASVSKHLRSDVPIGVALSGGIDSSAVASVIRHLEPDLEISTFSYTDESSEISEEPWVDLVNTRLGATPHKVRIDVDDLGRDLESLVASQGEPFGSTSIYAQYRVFRRVSEAGVKVMLEGQGADEMMAGYHGYPQARLRSLIEQRNFVGAIALIRKWGRWPGRDWKALSSHALAAALPALARNTTLRAGAVKLLKLEANQAEAFVKKEFLRAANQRPLIPSQEHHGRRLTEALGVALGEKGVTALLRHSDRNSMHFSVESRVPFLTTSFASLMLSLPEAYLLSDSGETKSVFRAAMRGIVPDEVLDRRDKIGFETKDQSWLRHILTSGRDFLAPIEKLEFVDIHQVRESLESAQRIGGSLGWSNWRAINFSVWYELNFP